jgi:hypothetical protein
MPGTYGSVLAILRHLADNDAAAYAEVAQQPVPGRLKDTSTLDEIAARVRRLDPRWRALADHPCLPNRELSDPHGTALAVALRAQAIHHADVHRAQIQTILGAHGISAPTLDLWEYGAAAGYVHGPST